MAKLCVLHCFQDKPGTCVPAGLQGRLQNPVSREERQMKKLYIHSHKTTFWATYKHTNEMRSYVDYNIKCNSVLCLLW